MINHGGYTEWEQADFENDMNELRRLWKAYKKLPKMRNQNAYAQYVMQLELISGRYHMAIEDITCSM